MNLVPLIFDRRRQFLLKSRSLSNDKKPYFLYKEIEQILLERLAYIKRPFSKVLLTSPVSQDFIGALLSQGHGERYIVALYPFGVSSFLSGKQAYRIIGDEEKLPFAKESFNLIISCLGLHQLNDVMGNLIISRSLLEQEGLYLASFWGGDTLLELRKSFLQAESDLMGGAFPRVHPMITLEDAMNLFKRAGFKWPIIDHEKFKILYPSLSLLLKDIKNAGESTSLIKRARHLLPRDLLKHTEAIYRRRFGTADEKLTATINVIFLTGWT